MPPSSGERARRGAALATKADRRACAALLRAGSKSFYAASLLLPRRVRGDATALYAFCRVADDAVDDLDSAAGSRRSKRALRRLKKRALDGMRERLAAAYAGEPHDSPVDRALADVARRRAIPEALLLALLEGFQWDAEGKRYRTLADVRAYAARVAASVGAMMTLLMGPRAPEVLARACDLGVAMQLTNIARDVGDDARAGRLYLPLEWLEEAAISPDELLARPTHSPALAAVVERLVRYADTLYARADAGVVMLPRDCRAAIGAAGRIYAEIGREIEAAGFDSVSRRAVVSGRRKLGLVVRAWLAAWRSGEASQSTRSRAPALREVRFLVDAAAGHAKPVAAGRRASTRPERAVR